MPYVTIKADNDRLFFEKRLPEWERHTGFTHVAGTIERAIVSYRKISEPRSEKARLEHLRHAKKMADPSKPFAC